MLAISGLFNYIVYVQGDKVLAPSDPLWGHVHKTLNMIMLFKALDELQVKGVAEFELTKEAKAVLYQKNQGEVLEADEKIQPILDLAYQYMETDEFQERHFDEFKFVMNTLIDTYAAGAVGNTVGHTMCRKDAPVNQMLA